MQLVFPKGIYINDPKVDITYTFEEEKYESGVSSN